MRVTIAGAVYKIVVVTAVIIDEGECGWNAHWTLDKEETLTISCVPGQYEGNIHTPTYSDYGKTIKKIIIDEGITAIGLGVFKNCTSLTSVVIPDSVTSIGSSAFFGCTSLESVTIPDSVKSIGDSAFYGCSGLASVVIPDSVTCIEKSAFCECTSLTSVVIPDSVTSIGALAFESCSKLKDIYYSGSPDQWNAINGSSSIPSGATIHYPCAVTCSENPTAGGTVSVNPDQSVPVCSNGKYWSDTSITLTATANDGYVFVNWTDENGNVIEDGDGKPVGATYTFTVGDGCTLTANFKIPLTITAKDQTFVYDGDIQGPGDADYDNPDDINRMVNVDGLMDGDALVSIEVDGQSDKADSKVYSDVLVPGAARIERDGKDVTGQYDITYVKGDIVIEPAEAIVTTGSASKVYDGKALRDDEVSIAGLVNGETATVVATGSRTEVGSSPNTYRIDWGTTNDENYAVTEKLGTLTVAQKPVTITVDSASKAQGEPDPVFTGTVEGLVAEGDLGEVKYVREGDDEAPGTYGGVLTVTYTKNDNYDVTVVPGDFTIEAAPAKPTYVVTSGEGSTYTEGSGEPMVFKIERTVDPETAFEHFVGIQVDGQDVPERDESGNVNWTARSGSVIVELQPNYLKTLPKGKHTLTALFDDSDPVSAEFSVAAPVHESKSTPSASKPSSGTSSVTPVGSSRSTARTGDGLPPAVPIALALAVVSGLALAGFALHRCSTRADSGRHARR